MLLDLKFCLFIFASVCVKYCVAQSPLAIQYNEAKKAYERKDYSGYLMHTQKADSISPNHPTLTYNLASAYALTGDSDSACEFLKKVVLMNTDLYPHNDTDFESIKALPAFREITSLKNELLVPTSLSQMAFTTDEKDLHPESLVYDPVTNSFLISSVHKNKIVSYSVASGKTSDWKRSNEDGLWTVLGMKRDSKRKVLWVCTVATKEMMNYDENLEGRTALMKYDLRTKKLLKRYDLDGGHWFGDLVLGEDGTPYISDSTKPIIYTINNDQLEVFVNFSNQLFNLQGLAFNKGQKMLYIADYKLGLYVYDMKAAKLNKVAHPDHITTKGIDGLYYYHEQLIAIHNGVNPLRVCEYQLAESGKAISDIKYIDRGGDSLGEPTLGVISRGSFYYIANSPWGKYDKEGNIKADELTENVVRKYTLDKPKK